MEKARNGVQSLADGHGAPVMPATHRARVRHAPAQPCSDLVALCMGLPALMVLLFGFWWLGLL